MAIATTSNKPKAWFSSDLHYYHRNILKFCPNTRGGCKDVEEMNEMIIRKHNSVVQPDDLWYNLGDLGFWDPQKVDKLIPRMNGRKHLIKGNHDTDKFIRRYVHHFDSIQEYAELNFGKTHIILFHFPISQWHRMHHGSIHLHGHTHGGFQGEGKILDVGIDNRPNGDMLPWSLEEVLEYTKDLPILKHH